jgi:NAD(P)-dependent dehydrogenase (short-subunit alcohol dehydrogenase family)
MKKTIIIGGNTGIGKIIYDTLKKRGDKIVKISRFQLNNKENLSADINSIEGLVKIKKRFYKKKIHNIIFAQRYRGEDTLEEYKVMVESTDKLILLFKKNLLENASIIILSSIASSTIVPEQNASYHYTRGALETLVKYYACNLGNKKIRVNCIQPSTIFKPENKFFYDKKNIKRKIIEKITPLKRMGDAKDVADLVEFLTSDKSTFITGSIIPVDGGLRLISQEQIAKILNK